MRASMVGLLAGMGQGYTTAKIREDENARRDRLDQVQLDRAARETEEHDRNKRQQQELADAAAPVSVTEAPSFAVDDEGTPSASALQQRAFMTGLGKSQRRFADQAGAEAAAAEANSPDAVRARQVGVMSKFDPARAAQLDAAGMQLLQSRTALAAQTFDASMSSAAVQGYDKLSEWMNSLKGPQAQVKFLPTAEGKVELNVVNPDGSLKPTGQVHENSPKGALDFALMLSHGTPLDKKAQYFQSIAKDRSDSAFKDKTLDLHGQQLNETTRHNLAGENLMAAQNERLAQHQAALLGIEGKKLDLAQGADPFAKVPGPVKAMYTTLSDQSKVVTAALAKAQAEGNYDPKNPGTIALMEKLASLNIRMDTVLAPHIKGGQDKASKDPLNLRGDPPAASADPGAPAAKTPSPGARPAPPQPGRVGRMAERAAKWVGDRGIDYTSETGKARLVERAQEAGAGGAALNDIELLRARQAGLVK